MTREAWFWWVRLLVINSAVFQITHFVTDDVRISMNAALLLTMLMVWAEVTFTEKWKK